MSAPQQPFGGRGDWRVMRVRPMRSFNVNKGRTAVPPCLAARAAKQEHTSGDPQRALH